MPPEERRASLIEATLPLLLTHGPSLTTKQVAEAAGVAEGTIFRAFPSLNHLIDATTREALSAKRLRTEIAALTPGESLLEKTETALTVLMRRMGDIRNLLHTVHHGSGSAEDSPGFDTARRTRGLNQREGFDTTALPRSPEGDRLNQPESDQAQGSPGFDTARRTRGLNQRDGVNQRGGCLRDELEARRQELDAWLLEQLEPHIDELAATPQEYIELLRTLALGHVFTHDATLTVETLAHFALHGAGKAS